MLGNVMNLKKIKEYCEKQDVDKIKLTKYVYTR